MTVTDITEINKSRSGVIIDGEFAFVLYKGELRQYKLQKGSEIPEEIYKEIMQEVLPKRAKLRCMNLLQSKDYSVMQLRRKLEQGKYPAVVIEEALAYVASYHYTDDLRYAKDYIFYNNSGKSRMKIEQDLMQKGISGSIIEKAWEEWYEEGNEHDECTQIRALLEKKHYDPSACDRKEMAKLYGFLMRKGYSSENIRKMLQNFDME